jgi:hypothetical protein
MLTGRPIEVQGIPCQLKRELRMTSCPPLDGKGPRVRLEKWMLYLYVHPEFNQALMREMNKYSLPMAYAPQIAAPADLEVDYYVGNGDEDVEHPETEIVDEPETLATNGNGKLDSDKTAFFAAVLEQIPYYADRSQIVATLKQMGFGGYSKEREEKMLAALHAYANKHANEAAAQGDQIKMALSQ